MKLSRLGMSLFGQIIVLAQSSTKAMNSWDSLHSRTTEEIKRFEEIARENAEYIDTLINKGSITFAWMDINKNELKVITHLFNSENCVASIQYEYYNSMCLLAFRKVYKIAVQEKRRKIISILRKLLFTRGLNMMNRSA